MKFKIIHVIDVESKEEANNCLKDTKDSIIDWLDLSKEDYVAGYVEKE